MADQKLTELTALPNVVASGDFIYVVRNGVDYVGDFAQLGDAALLDVGTTSGTVAAGDDSRFTDSRTPTAHASSHAAAGGDPITIAQSQVTNLTTDLAGKLSTAGTAADVNPAGTSIAAALAAKEPTITAGTTAQYWRGDKSFETLNASAVGLGSVTNDAQTKAAIVPNTAPSAGQILAGNAGGTAYAPVSLSGDATLASTGALTLANTNVTAGTYTNPTATVDAKGRITNISNGAGGSGFEKWDVTFDGQGQVVSNGVTVYRGVAATGNIAAGVAVSDVAGNLTITVSKYTPSGSSIGNATTLGNIVLNVASWSRDTTLSGWTKNITAGDVLGFATAGTVANVTRVTVTLSTV